MAQLKVCRASVTERVAGARTTFSLVVACVIAACGGRIDDDRERKPADATGLADASRPELHGDAGSELDECPFRSIRIELTQVGTMQVSDGIEVEPLQIPSFGVETRGDTPHPSPPVWDTNPLPAGACVFHLRGVDATCYRKSAELFLGPCDEHLISPASFYEQRGCDATPGCTGPEWGGADPAYWWYLAPSGADSNLVFCAAECEGELGARGACLFLDSHVLTCAR